MNPPTIPQALELALGHHRAGRLGEAEAIYRQILGRDPKNPDALHLLGVVMHQTGQREAAMRFMRAAIEQRKDIAEFHADLGGVLGDLGQWHAAAEAYRVALSLQSDSAEGHVKLAQALRKIGRPEDALACYRRALVLKPNLPAAHNNLGNLLQEMGRGDDAIDSYRTAIALRPDYVQALSNLATALLERDQADEAVQLYLRAMELGPAMPELYNNLGKAMRDKGAVGQAIQAFRRATALRPDYADAHWNLALMLLLNGEYAEGWAEYEWRWKVEQFPGIRRGFAQPLWDGRDLGGATILLHAEQGFGDTIQFVRYVSAVAERGGKIILESPRELIRLFRNLPQVDQLVTAGEPLPQFEWQCPLLSLPHALGTTLETIPAPIGYLKTDPMLVQQWREKLKLKPGELNVGISWSGNPKNVNDRRRSIPLTAFERLAAIGGVRLHSIQKELPSHSCAADWSSALTDFADAAALIANMDVVISVDTASAHLAAAIGKPTWVLLPFAPDPRWLLNRDDSPWYPMARLFRQPAPGDWETVLERVEAELKSAIQRRDCY